MPQVIDMSGKVQREEPVPAVFSSTASEKLDVIFRAVHREYANRRAGTASTLRRDEVSGGGKKPWRQKGTGRARHGSIRSPQWRHGGIVFGPKPRSYQADLNKKERRTAFIAALSDRFNNGAVTLLDVSEFDLKKSRDLAALLFGSSNVPKGAAATLIIYGQNEYRPVGEQLHLAGRNLRRVGITHAGALDVKDVLRFKRLIFTSAAYGELRERLERHGS
ncbi:MAG: 50S ribosomal protein L4 [Candidatus Eremiobacteraeota bacterium]|nr:50S ribosomal protein L4 [Candidatus Eremiobacteraeota bacterium]